MRIWVLGLWASAGPVVASRAQPAEPPAQPAPAPAPADEGDPAIAAALSTVLDVGATETVRLDAARTLLGFIGSEGGRLAVIGVLGHGGDDPSARWIMVRALAREPWLPEALLDPLIGVVDGAEGDRLARALSAIASIRTPRALRAVAAYLDGSHPESARTAALSALVRATGRDELGSSPGAWNEWIDRSDASDGQDGLRPTWSVWVLRGLTERADRQATRARDLATRLTDAQRRLYLATPVDQRPALLASMIRDDLAEVRSVAFELLERELVATANPGPDVVSAVLSLLTHPSAPVRAQAAGVLSRIAPEGAGEAVASALRAEQDPAAAAALLTAAARWPSDEIREPVLHWLDNGPGIRPVASEAALAMHRAGRWTAEDLERIAGAMRRPSTSELTPPGIRLIAAIGTLDDRRRLAELLMMGSPTQRATVADALFPREEHLDAILAAASHDPTLVPAAARGVAQHRPTLGGFRAILRLRVANDVVRREALRTVGGSLSTGDLLSAADEMGGDTATTLWLLEQALARSQQAVASGEDGAMALLHEAGERLARRRLDLDRPAEAIAALDLVPEQSRSSRLKALRAVALIVLGRLDDARGLDVGPDPWLEALDRCTTTAHATEVLATIQREFGAALTDSQRARYDALSARVQAIGLIAQGRLDDVWPLGVGPDAWIDGLDRCVGAPHAAEVLAAIRREFGASLTQSQRERLEALATRLEPGETADAPPG